MGDNDQLIPNSDDLPGRRVSEPRSLHLWCRGSVSPPIGQTSLDPDPEHVRGAHLQSLNCETIRCLDGLAGRKLEWWACRDRAGQVTATFYGSGGLAVSVPLVTSGAELIDYVRCDVLGRPLDHEEIEHRPRAGAGRRRTTPLDVTAAEIGLDRRARGVLANLPNSARRGLLHPLYTRGERVRRCDWHYEGVPAELSMFLLYLVGDNHLTVAYGRRTIPVGHTTATAHWSLLVECRPVVEQRVAVLRYPGTR